MIWVLVGLNTVGLAGLAVWLVRRMRDNSRTVNTTAALTATHLDQVDEVMGRSCERLVSLEEWRAGCQIHTR